MLRRAKASQGGFGLMAVLVIAILIGGVAGAFFIVSMNEQKYTEASRNTMKSTYLAEAGAEDAAHAIRSAIANQYTVPAAGTIMVSGVAVNYAIQFIAGSQRVENSPTGLQTTFQQFEIVAEVPFSQGANRSLGRVIKTVDAGATPIFQFLAFYNNDLEFLPGPAAVVHGRMHSNKDMYLGAGASMNVYGDHVQAVGQMYRKRKDNGTTMAGTVSVEKQGSGTLAGWANGFESTNASWAAASQSSWNGTVKNGATGAVKMETPALASIQPGGYFDLRAQNGGLVIRDSQAFVGSTNVTLLLPAGTLATTNIYDAREGKSVPVTTIDMAKLKASAYYPANGLLYAERSANSSATPKGIHIKNGAELPSGLTIVSPAPVYVQGDYNTGGATPANKRPAAIISDAVNLLSNAWTNTKTSTSALPVASNTSYNFAMISGNQDTVPGAYNGGLENLPRFHENWSAKNCNIKGSFVNLYTSQIAKGKWVYGGNRYTAPNRNWDFDTDFNNPSKLPPFTPMAVAIGRTTYEEGYRAQ